MVKVTDPLGGVRRFEYDPMGNLVTQVDENGVVTTYEYDALNRLITQNDAKGNKTHYEYNHLGLLMKRTDALGNVTAYDYDALGRMIKETDPIGAIRSFEYDLNGNLIKEIDQLGYEKTYHYDALNRLVAEVNALGQTTTYEYDPKGNLLQVINAKGDSYSYEYDALDRLIKEVNYQGGTQSYAYDPNGNLIRKTDFSQKQTTYKYDQLNRLLETVFADGSKKFYTYDAVGNMRTAINETVTEKFYYDDLSRLVKAETIGLMGEGTEVVEFTYNKVGDPQAITTSLSTREKRKVKYAYDELNRLTKVSLPDGGEVAFTYDPLNRVVERSNSNWTKTKYTYTPRGEIESIVNYEKKYWGFGKVISAYGYLYNARGERTYQIRGNGEITVYKYDPAGRIKEAYYPLHDQKKLLDLKERYEYGLLPPCKGPQYYKFDFSSIYKREERENFQEQMREFLNSLNYGEPDDPGRHGWGGTDEIRIRLESRYIKTLDLSHEDGAALNKLYGRIGEYLRYLNFRDLRFWGEEFDYDPNGNITAKRNGWGEITYQYNRSNQLTQAGFRIYEYDPNGNLNKEIFGGSVKNYEYNQENRLVRIENGIKMPFKDQICIGRQIEYHYDALGRKVGKEVIPFMGHEKDVEYYIYNGLGIDVLLEYRVKVRIDQEHGAGPHHGHYYKKNRFRNYWQFGPWSAGSKREIREYYYGNGMLLAAKDMEKDLEPGFGCYGGWYRNPLENVTFYHHDALGSVVMLTNDQGHAVEKYEYDVYGNAYSGKFSPAKERFGHGYPFGYGCGYGYGSSGCGSKPGNVYGFTGQRFEPESGLYAFTYRHYNPQMMRWLTVDPIKDGLNWYEYCGGDPVNWVDPTGLWEENIHYGSEEYGGTLQWAKEVGFTEKQAEIIAKANQFVDSPSSGKCFIPIIGDQRYHFNTNRDAESGSVGDSRKQVAEEHLQNAIALQKQADALRESKKGGVLNIIGDTIKEFKANKMEKEALKELGTGLHAIQDISAHQDQFVEEGSILRVDYLHHLGEKGKQADNPLIPGTDTLNERYYQARTDTKEYLQRFKNR